MRRLLLMAATLMACTYISAKQHNSHGNGYPISQVPFTSVKITTESFWGSRIKAAREVTIPLAFSKCESEGRYENFVKAAHPSDKYKVSSFMGFSFDDTDVYKTIEGASYVLQTYPDKRLEAYIDSILNIVAAAQEHDGYLYTARTINPKSPHHWAGPSRWSKVEELSHEFYNLGHMVDAACAHFQATGSDKFLNIARRYADCIIREVGDKPGQACVVPGHQIAEMALARLYVMLNSEQYRKSKAKEPQPTFALEDYLRQAKFFLDYRGRTSIKNPYSQSHLPVTEQREAVGHAVRAGYMYAGMADVAALTGDTAYTKAIDAIWRNIIEKKYYITGGVGARHDGEAYGNDYELPNLSAYNETCAAISLVYLCHRMFLMHGHAKYIDCLERTLYNGVISGMSVDGGKFFYPNPLESRGNYERKSWFGCACCPSNICRFIPSLPGYFYAVRERNLYINLYAANNAEISMPAGKVAIEEHTDYPWDGNISIKITKNTAGKFCMMLRLPGWCCNSVTPGDLYAYNDSLQPEYSVSINGTPVNAYVTDGYIAIDRKWRKGDIISLHLDMPPRTVISSEKITGNKRRTAIERGPLVYCAEWPDNDFDIFRFILNKDARLYTQKGNGKMGNIVQIKAEGRTIDFGKDGKLHAKDALLTLTPYYSWAHRGQGDMTVWIANDIQE